MSKVTQKRAHKTALSATTTSRNNDPVKSTYLGFLNRNDMIWVEIWTMFSFDELCRKIFVLSKSFVRTDGCPEYKITTNHNLRLRIRGFWSLEWNQCTTSRQGDILKVNKPKKSEKRAIGAITEDHINKFLQNSNNYVADSLITKSNTNLTFNFLTWAKLLKKIITKMWNGYQ